MHDELALESVQVNICTKAHLNSFQRDRGTTEERQATVMNSDHRVRRCLASHTRTSLGSSGILILQNKKQKMSI